MTTLPVLNGNNLLTHSRISCAKSCLRKHHYRYEIGVRRDRDSQPLRMGSAVHVGIDALAQGKDLADALAVATADYDAAPDWCVSDEQVADWMVECEKVRRLIAAYHWRYSEDSPEVLSTEQAFDIPIVNPDTGGSSTVFRFGGKIDKIVRLPDGRVAVMEHKTTGDQIDSASDYWIRLRLDHQITGYYIGAQSLGHDIQTVLYDVIRKPSIAPKKCVKAELAAWPTYYGETQPGEPPERETPAMYGARLTQDIGDRPDFYFARREIPRLAADIEEFRAELWQTQQMLRDCQRGGRWFRNTAACLSPYKCDYFELCANGIDPSVDVPSGFVRVSNVHPELGV